MANVYYKTNDQYRQLTYYDIGAAAQNHTHFMSDIGMLNFKNNGCMGQHVLENIDNNYHNLLYYVPEINSNTVYAKRISNDKTVYNTVPWCNINQTKTFAITPTANFTTAVGQDINSNLTTFYEYQGINSIITMSLNDLSNYYCYYYPLNIKCNTTTNIEISFKTNLENNDDIYKIVCVFNENTSKFSIIAQTIPASTLIIKTLGIIQYKSNQIIGICIILTQQNIKQIELSDLKIKTDQIISVSQNYNDYYDISQIAPIENSGSLGEPINDEYNRTESDMLRYYRSYKFFNLLTWEQSITIPQCLIPGYTVQSTQNSQAIFKHGYFHLHWPYEIDTEVLDTHTGSSYNDIITLEVIQANVIGFDNQYHTHAGEIWALGTYAANNLTLIPGTTNTSGKISYNIVTVKPGFLGIEFYFPNNMTANINNRCPLKFLAEGGLKVTIISKPNN